ncbi:hypothetical protein J4209_00640 [Candidatus Woesearchaeota archaeon]|nr:hypothetical protein [Candidatus Woesearchaeota archaeon]
MFFLLVVAIIIVGGILFYLYSDRDKDGVPNIKDNCKNDHNPKQYDSDSDDKGDACDVNLFMSVGTFDPVKEKLPYPKELTTKEETGYYIIQFNQTIEAGWDEKARKYIDIEALFYIPDYAWAVYTTESIETLRKIQFVRSVIILQPANRMSPELVDMFKKGELDSEEEIEVEIYPFKKLDDITDKIKQLTADYRKEKDKLRAVVQKNKIKDIAFIPEVKWISRVYPESTNTTDAKKEAP